MGPKGRNKEIDMVKGTETFIREGLRKLPVETCFINEKWLTSGKASIVIARKHPDEKISCGIFLVDLLCLGVKDSFYLHHITQNEFEEVLDAMEENEALLEVEYILMHSLIIGAIDYAGKFGFEPHVSFNLTQYFLDEREGEDGLIEIPFGMNGKPAILTSAEDHQEELIKLLEERVGVDNYTVMDIHDCENLRQTLEFGPEYFSYNDLISEEKGSLEQMLAGDEDSLLGDYQEYTELQLLDEIKLLGKEDITNAIGAVHELYYRIQGGENMDVEFDKQLSVFDELTVVNDFDFPGLDFLPEEQADLFFDLSEMIEQEPENAIPEIMEAIQNYPHPIFEHLLVSAYSYLNQEEKSREVLEIALEKYSNDFMLRIGYGFNLLMEEKYQALKMYMSNFDIRKIVPERNIFHITEIGRFLSLACSYYAVTGQLKLATCLQSELDLYTGIPEVTYYQKLATFNILCPMQWEVIKQHYNL